jgi:FkbM family methyltransferase
MLDVGGNIGQSVLSIYSVFPEARVLSFEPNPAVFSKLQRLTKKFPQLEVSPNGVSDKTGKAELFIPSYNGSLLTGLASFEYESATSWLGKNRVLRFDPNKVAISSTQVSLVRLDDLRLKPDFIKIDVQGLEYRVLAGGLDTIRKYRPVIMAETVRPGSDAHRVVQSLGYRLMEFDGRGFTDLRDLNWRLNQFLIPSERLPNLLSPCLKGLALHPATLGLARVSGQISSRRHGEPSDRQSYPYKRPEVASEKAAQITEEGRGDHYGDMASLALQSCGGAG